jgi:hypothetical protein
MAASHLPSTAAIIGCLEEAQKAFAYSTPRNNWWADVHLADAAKELAALRRIVAKLSKEL